MLPGARKAKLSEARKVFGRASDRGAVAEPRGGRTAVGGLRRPVPSPDAAASQLGKALVHASNVSGQWRPAAVRAAVQAPNTDGVSQNSSSIRLDQLDTQTKNPPP